MADVCPHTNMPVQGGEDSTRYFKDADAFRADASCVTKYRVPRQGIESAFTHPNAVRVEDRRGKASHKWIKLADTNGVTIDEQSCGGSLPKYFVNTFATAHGYQDQYCWNDGTGPGGSRCAPDGILFAANNYFICKISGDTVSDQNGAWNSWWLLTDLDSLNDGSNCRLSAPVIADHLSPRTS